MNEKEGDNITKSIFKVLNPDGSPCWGGKCNWPLPNEGIAGEWVEVKNELEETSHGLHLCRIRALPYWIGPAIFSVEYEGEIRNEGSDTPFVRKARLLSRFENWDHDTLRSYAEECYNHVMPKIKKNIDFDKKKTSLFEELLEKGIYKQIPRQAAHLADIFENEIDWQVEKLLKYLNIR
jgi:hypothetical protein